jgi:hypothetical protein
MMPISSSTGNPVSAAAPPPPVASAAGSQYMYGDASPKAAAVRPGTVSNRTVLGALGLTAVVFTGVGLFLGGRVFRGGAPAPPAPTPLSANVPDSWRVDGHHAPVNIDQRLNANGCDAAFQASGVTSAETGVVQGAAVAAGAADWCTTHSDDTFASPLDDQVGAFVMTADFGRNGFCCQVDVAKEMAIAAAQMVNTGCLPHGSISSISRGINFAINGGDAFYEIGLQTTRDPHIRDSWRNIYLIHPELDKSWYGVLGNHDYMGSVNALVDLTTDDEQAKWKLGDPTWSDSSKATVTRDPVPRDAARRYSFHEETFCDDSIGLFVYLDTSPYLPQYYHDIDQGWCETVFSLTFPHNRLFCQDILRTSIMKTQKRTLMQGSGSRWLLRKA